MMFLDRNGMRRASAALLVTLGFWVTFTARENAARAFAPPASDTGRPQGKLRDKDLPNFAQVDRGIYRGAAPTAAGLSKLKSMGVRTIVDLRIEKHGQAEEAATAQSLRLTRVRIRLGKEAPTKKQVAEFLSILKNAGNEPVYVHCQYGADRTGSMIGIYRVTQQGWTFERAYKEMLRYGFKPYLSELKAAVRERAAAR